MIKNAQSLSQPV